jgi:cell division protein FtsL
MTSVRVHTRAAPRRDPAPAPRVRPPLRVVTPDYVPPRVRRRRAGLFAAAVSSLVVLGLLGIASLHVVLTQGQFRLDRLQQQADQQQARYEQLRLQVAELESPDRIVAVAQERLGMVPPAAVTYLAPTQPAAGATPRPAAPPRATGTGPSTSWSEVKPHLATGP